jgi:hypothetical protein
MKKLMGSYRENCPQPLPARSMVIRNSLTAESTRVEAGKVPLMRTSMTKKGRPSSFDTTAPGGCIQAAKMEAKGITGR